MKKRGLPNYNPINQAANSPPLLYEKTDLWQMEMDNPASNKHSSSIAHNLQQLHFLLLGLQFSLKAEGFAVHRKWYQREWGQKPVLSGYEDV